MTITQIKENLSAMLHGGTLNKVRNIESLFERAANTLLSKIDPVDTQRIAPLASTIHDDIYNYALPSDYKNIIDLYPQSNRNTLDSASRRLAERFDLRKELNSKRISIEGNDGTKFIRINWRSRQGKTLHSMNDYDDNGTWVVVGTATNVEQDTITKFSGGGSVRFDVAASGDGIQNTTMTAVDLTDEDEVADVFCEFYIKNSTDLGNLNSITLIWGNDLTTNYWTGVAQTTQADGTAFKVGWNQVKKPWSTATETGTVAPSTTDSAKVTFDVDAAITDIRVDNIVFSIGRNFDVKYYSKYLFKNSSGTWITKPTSDDDEVVLDNDAIQIYLLECLIAAAHQMEGSDSGFDINFAKQELNGNPNSPDPNERMGLYAKYRREYPSEAKKPITSYGSLPNTRSR